MSISRKRLRRTLGRAPWLLLALVPVLVAAPIAAEGFGQCKKCWTLKGFGAYVDPTDDDVAQNSVLADGASQRLDYSLGEGVGFGLAAEYHLSCRIGLEAALLAGNLDSRFMLDIDEAWDMTDSDVGFTAITLGPNFHLTPDSPVDFYIGPFLSLMQLDGERYNLLGQSFNVDFDDELGFGVQAGLNVPFGETSKWAFHAAARYIDANAEVTGLISPVEIDINPFILSAGLAYSPRSGKAESCVDEEPPPPPALPEPPEPLPPPPPAPKPPPPPPPPPPAPPAPKPEQRETIYFDSGSSRVSNIAKAILDEVALRMQQDSSLTAHIIGHTDATGSTASNQARSEGRAEASKSYLVTRHGIDPARITTVGMGSSEPVADNSTAEGRRANRRAEIVLKSN